MSRAGYNREAASPLDFAPQSEFLHVRAKLMGIPKPRYEVKQEPHPDDENEVEVPEAEFEPRGDETLPDVLRRVGGIGKAARRMWQALDATVPQGWPDYRSRIYASIQMRDTVEGTPDKRKPQTPANPTDTAPPGVLRGGKGKPGHSGAPATDGLKAGNAG